MQIWQYWFPSHESKKVDESKINRRYWVNNHLHLERDMMNIFKICVHEWMTFMLFWFSKNSQKNFFLVLACFFLIIFFCRFACLLFLENVNCWSYMHKIFFSLLCCTPLSNDINYQYPSNYARTHFSNAFIRRHSGGKKCNAADCCDQVL